MGTEHRSIEERTAVVLLGGLFADERAHEHRAPLPNTHIACGGVKL